MAKPIVSERVRELRVAAGLTQEQLSERAKIGNRALQRLEAGETNANVSTIEALATALNVAVPDLFVSYGSGSYVFETKNSMPQSGSFSVPIAFSTSAQSVNATYTLSSAAATLSNPRVSEALEIFARLSDEAQATALVTLRMIASDGHKLRAAEEKLRANQTDAAAEIERAKKSARKDRLVK